LQNSTVQYCRLLLYWTVLPVYMFPPVRACALLSVAPMPN
jgi:hypothetical protein